MHKKLNTRSATAKKSRRSPRPRLRGGQPGNLNALKHGFYARHFTELEIDDLAGLDTNDLTGEIKMMRIVIRRVLQSWADASTVADQVALFDAISKGMVRLATLLKARYFLDNGGRGGLGLGSDWESIFAQALEEMQRDDKDNQVKVSETDSAGRPLKTGSSPSSEPAARPNGGTGTQSANRPSAWTDTGRETPI